MEETEVVKVGSGIGAGVNLTPEAPEEIKSDTVKDTERIRLETEELEKAIAEKQNADARAKIEGVTDAGQKPEEKKEETPQEYKDRVMKGQV